MVHRIEMLQEKKLAGRRLNMSFNNNQTLALWQQFMPLKKQVQNPADECLYSVEVYPSTGFFSNFDPSATFEKWAAVQVAGFDSVPGSLECLIIPNGLYAVFSYKGHPANGPAAYRYIFQEWMPQSGFEVDERPHFAVMGDKYKNDDPGSEEDIYIPVRPRWPG